METQKDQIEKAGTLALQILNYTRDTLMVNLRFLDAALNRLEFTPYAGTLACDGYHMYYDPRHILRCYKAEQNSVTRDILHLIFHCVFQHICIPDGADLRLWNLSCDIACEYTVSGLHLRSAECLRQQRQEKVFPRLEADAGMLTAEKIYKYYSKSRPDEETLAYLENTFKADDHSRWTRQGETLSTIWSGVSRRMQVDMETFTRQQGSRAGAVLLNLQEVNREISDYAGFMAKFLSKGDGMKLDPDEWDYTMYSLGMQLSGGKMPLIEPVEYRDSARIKDVVMAVIVSENTPVQKIRIFLRNTWSILHANETFFSKVRLHLLTPPKGSQAFDAEADFAGNTLIHTVISSQEDIDSFVNNLDLIPYLGNDFRPAFNRTADLNRKRSFKNLRGLIAVADQAGAFPAQMPAFPGAFVFLCDDYSQPAVPAWGIRLTMQKDEL